MKIRLQDILATEFSKTYRYNEPVRAEEFTTWLSGQLPEADLTATFPLAVSAGLRTLHELGLVHLEARRDTDRTTLYYVDGDPINDFSHVTVSEEVCR
ncbi:hypothetical protein SDC9_183394 [bioreactor metagenome]|uniref:Uncharacterized protein n=1 Tax=bioreactor metagenome TaxID=1076179 RepID=A0A645HBZ8_9ZZZZ